MDEFLYTIKEVHDGGKRLANHYLEKGYILLDIQHGTRNGRFPADNPAGFQFYVRKEPVYIVGRPEGVEPCEPFNPRKEDLERRKEEDQP